MERTGCLSRTDQKNENSIVIHMTNAEWNNATQCLLSENTKTSVYERISQICPQVTQSITSDSKKEGLKKLWGLSINFDEFEKDVIVDPKIIEALVEVGKFPPPIVKEDGSQIVHAGIQHTYGYLFSSLVTNFGYKRARWIEGNIEDAFQLAPGAMSPYSKSGSLFSNVTFFMGKIAFRNDAHEVSELENFKDSVDLTIRDFPYGSLKTSRIEEEVILPNSNGDKFRKFVFRTDLVPPINEHGKHLLIYSVYDSHSNQSQLISGFPVDADFAEVLRNSKAGKTLVETRYNAFVKELTGKTIEGTRRITYSV